MVPDLTHTDTVTHSHSHGLFISFKSASATKTKLQDLQLATLKNVACHMASRLAETSGRRRLTFHGAGLAEFFLGGGGWPMKIFGGGGEFGV